MAVTINGTTGILAPDIGIDGTTLTVDAVNNRVGIGTSSPATTLQINESSNEATISLVNAGAKKTALQASTSFGSILYSYDSEPLIFSVSTGQSFSEKLRITSGGKLISQSTHSNGAVNESLRITTTGTYSSSNSLNSGPAISFGQFHGDYPTWTTAQVVGIRKGNNWHGDLAFYTNNGSSETDISEKLRIDSSGRVLLGTTSLIDSSVASNLQVASDFGPRFNIARSDTTTAVDNLIGAFDFYGNDSNGTYQNCARILAEADLDHGTDDKPTRLTFYTTPDGSATPTERLRINKDGVVLVGGTTVQGHGNMDDLQVGDASGNRGITISSGTSNFGTVAFGDSADGSGTDRYSGFVEYYHDDNSMRLGTVSSERLRIDSNGRVLVGPGAIATPKCGYAGIDISNYDYAIVMGGSDGNGNRANNAIKDGRFCGAHYTNAEEPVGIIRYSIGSTASEIHMGGGSSLINAATQLSFYTAANTTTTGGTERLRINSGGQVLINDTSLGNSRTDAPLQIETGGSGNALNLRARSSDDIYSYINFQNNAATQTAAEIYMLRSATNNAGNLVFGTANPNSSTPQKRMMISSGGATSLHVNSASHETFRFTTQALNEAKLIMQDASGNSDIVLNTGGTSWITGGLGIGGSSSANTIDEYEEGSYTPKIYAGTGTTEPSYNWRYGQYVRIGEVVHIWGTMGISGSMPSCSEAYIGNLPYNQLFDSNNFFHYTQLHGYTWASGYGDSGSETRLFIQSANGYGNKALIVNGSSKNHVSNSMVGSGQRFTFQFSYVIG